jgi:hypothetical protein
MSIYCTCRACKRARREGKVLGDRRQGYFSNGVFGFGRVSDYIRWAKFARKGSRRPEAKDTGRV